MSCPRMETYFGHVRTPADAIKLFEACRIGALPRVQRRLSEKERQQIRSGSVYVWDEREAGMRRWTDGKSWSASRVSGSFLTYREMEGKRGGGFGNGRRAGGKTPDSGRGSDEDQDDGEPEGYRYKADGLMKQSFSITTSTGEHLHLISYYSRQQNGGPELLQPTTDPNLKHIVPAKGMYPESSLHDSAPTRYMLPQGQPQSQSSPYPPQYAQPGYGWPPSPVATPPYSAHYPPASYSQAPHSSQHQLPPPPVHGHPPHHSHMPPLSSPYPYDRPSLPPPPNVLPPAKPPMGPYGAQQLSPHLPHIQQQRPQDSPRSQSLQAQAAQAVMIDPRLAPTSARNPQGPLPAVASGGLLPAYGLAGAPPNRALSVSPPRSSHSDSTSVGPGPNNKTSLRALLHPTSEPGSAGGAGSNSANSSPRTALSTGGSIPQRPEAEDIRALRVLDRKFCI